MRADHLDAIARNIVALKIGRLPATPFQLPAGLCPRRRRARQAQLTASPSFDHHSTRSKTDREAANRLARGLSISHCDWPCGASEPPRQPSTPPGIGRCCLPLMRMASSYVRSVMRETTNAKTYLRVLLLGSLLSGLNKTLATASPAAASPAGSTAAQSANKARQTHAPAPTAPRSQSSGSVAADDHVAPAPQGQRS